MPTPRPSQSRTRRRFFAGLATAALLGATAVRAETAKAVHIVAGPLDTALVALAAQTHEQLLFSQTLVAGRKAPPLDGRYTVEQALARLLAATNITVTRTGPAMLILRTATAAAVAQKASEVQAARPFGGEQPAPDTTGTMPVLPAIKPAPQATVSEIEVTGTHIRGGGTGASPLAVLDHVDLERSGHLTVAGALSAIPQNFNGQDTELTGATLSDNRGVNSSFGTGVNLRGLGADATLVLVNGRRLGGAGSKGDFTDISTLPGIAVDRVEILLDGASAIYGSDAVGGVVNVLMRQRLDGGEARIDGGAGAGRSARESQLGLIQGHTWDSGGLVVAYELYHRTALHAADRDYTQSADLRPLGGSDFRNAFSHPGNILGPTFAPLFAIPAGQNGLGLTPSSFVAGTVNLQNPRLNSDVLPDQARQSAYLSVHQALGAHAELTGDAVYGFRRARQALSAPIALLFVTKANPFFVSPNGAAAAIIEYSFQGDLPPPIARSTAESLALTAGAKVDLWGDWRSDSFVDFSQETEKVRVSGILNSSLLSEALGNIADRPETPYSPARDGFFNPFTGVPANPAGALNAIGSGFTDSRGISRVYTLSSQADGSLIDLPAGPLKLAVGGQVRRETFLLIGTNYTSTVAPAPAQGTDVERTVGALFAELRAPVFGPDNARPGFRRLELSAAGRWERYSDFGSTLNPKIGVLWTPVADLNLRATYGRSFRAPGLRELNDPAFNTPVNLTTGGVRVLSLLLTGGNPNLRPETAQSWTAGLDWQPHTVPGLRFSATWFDVRYQHRIDTPVISVIQTALTDPAVATFVRRLDPTNPADLAAISALLADPATSTSQGSFPAARYGAIVDGRYVNTGALEVEGLDLTANYGLDLAGGRLDLSANVSDLLRYNQALTPTAAAVSRAGVVGFPAKLRSRLMAYWTEDGLTVGGALNSASAFHDVRGVAVKSLTTVDLQARLVATPTSRWAGMSVGVNARNVFNTSPAFYNNPQGFGFDPANADVVGRFISVQLTKTW